MKFVIDSLIGLVAWIIITFAAFTGNLTDGVSFVGVRKHPYLLTLYGLSELVALIAIFIVFAKITHLWWQALLITLGIYVAYLIAGTIVEVTFKLVKRLRKTSSHEE